MADDDDAIGEFFIVSHDSPRWCTTCRKFGDHHSDRHPPETEPLFDTPLFDLPDGIRAT